jgi:hypothetical protein
MIIVVTTVIEDEDTGRKMIVADYGVDTETDRRVCLPAEHPSKLGAVLDEKSGELVIR